MNSGIVPSIVLTVFLCLSSTSAYGQKYPGQSLNGSWKDDGNGQEINISVAPATGKVVATYSRVNKICPSPDRDGNPVSFQVDFDGVYRAGHISGSIYYCLNHTPGSGPPGEPKHDALYAVGVKSGPIELEQNADGTKLTGKKGTERISFTRMPLASGDIIIRRTGETDRGELKTCAGNQCQIGGSTVPRDQIAWIGISTDAAQPPAVGDPAMDEIHRRDGTVKTGRLVGVNSSVIVTATGTYDRKTVAWVYLAPAPPRPPLPGEMEIQDEVSEQSDQPPADKPPSSKPPSKAPPPSKPPPGSKPKPSGNTGKSQASSDCTFWVGDVNEEQEIDDPHFGSDKRHAKWNVTYHARLREVPPNYPRGEVLLINEGSRVEGSVEEEVIQPNGSSTHEFGFGTAKVLNPGINFGNSVGRLFITPQGAREKYKFELWPDEDHKDYTTTVRWFNADPTHSYTARPSGDTPGKAIFRGVLIPPNSDMSGHMVPPGGKMMEGEYSFSVGTNKWTTSWKLRSEIGPCIRPRDMSGEPDPKKDPCGPPTSERALLDTALKQEKALIKLSAGQALEIRNLQEQARQWKNDFEQAARDCKLWAAAQVLMNLLVSNTSPTNTLTIKGMLTPASAEAALVGEPGKELANFLSFLEKMSTGDQSWVLPNAEYKGFVSAEDVWEAFQTAYGAIKPPSTAEGLLDGLRSCGSPTTQGVMDGAVTYLRLLQQIEPKVREANKTLNDIRSKEQEVSDLWSKYHKACVDHANCKGTDPKACDTPPPPL